MAEPQKQADERRPPESLLSAALWSPPPAFDEYRLLSSIGQGGMGEIYLAHDTLLDRPVAIKFISGLEPDTASREQFLIEARAAARLQHPNVVTIHRVGELQGRPYIVEEFIHGKSLESLPKPMPWKRALELGLGLARGLAVAHRRGVLHRDIKPSNAIVSDGGEVKLLDFGLAKLTDVGTHVDDLAASIPEPAVSRDAPTIGPGDARGRSAPMSSRWTPSDTPPKSADVLRTPSERREDRFAPTEIERAPISAEKTAMSRRPSAPPAEEGLKKPARPSSNSSVKLWGTPLYMPPEIWSGEASSQSSDIYSLGALLYELCTGAPPFKGTPLQELSHATRTLPITPVAEVVVDIDPRFAEIVDRCLRRTPAERFGSGDELRDALEQIGTADRKGKQTVPLGNPYRGLLAFEAEHSRIFFGRDHEIRSIVERLRYESFVLVASDSGVGKSSICCAGVVPLVIDGALGEGRAYTDVRIAPGRHPLTVLVAALAPILDVDEDDLAAQLRAEPGSLGRDLRKRLGTERGLILFVDQLEELVTMSDPAEAAIVGEVLGGLTPRTPGIRTLMTIRSDFLTRVTAMPRLGDELSRGLYLLRPLPVEGIREAILGPARESGVSFESESLVDTLIASTAHAEGGLPLLQFALAELWEARDTAESKITSEALDHIGGVAGALARHADQIVGGLPTAQRAAARRILTALVNLDGTRASRTEVELVGNDAAARGTLEALLRGRLLIARDGAQGTIYEVAHEALLKGWGTLRGWLDEQADSRVVQQRLSLAAAEWERLGRTREALWGVRQITEAAIVDRGELKPIEAAFLDKSERAVRRDRRRRLIALLSVPVVAGLFYIGIQVAHRREIDRRVHAELVKVDASLGVARAKSKEQEEKRRHALETYDAKKRVEGDKLWTGVLESAEGIGAAYADVTYALETALAIDPERDSVRAQVADVLYERILATENENNPALRVELLHRLDLYDVGGERQRKLNAPAILSVKSSPEGAHVTVARFVESENQRTRLTDEQDLGITPTNELELSQGSYLIEFKAPDRPAVRYPVVARRGERLAIDIELPTKSDIPEGFVYIPPGRFLVGSSADEGLRKTFLTTVPLHEITTGGYLIARYETTYQDWIEYLRAQPPEERARHMPSSGTSNFTGSLHLRELPDGRFELTMQPTTQAYTVVSGEKVVYRSRRTHVVQDWQRFPVGGIMFEEAQMYARWLAQTGRVKGARLCTEYEWERAARGADGREFPHGRSLDPEDANFDETYGKDASSMGPDEVGSHPASESLFGLHDMAGNVHEWTWTSIDPPAGAVRGGAWYFSLMTSSCANRTVPEPTIHESTIGMRLCASLHAD